MQPRLTDNDKGDITVSLNGTEIRTWRYLGDNERQQKMARAREYVRGWVDGMEAGTRCPSF